MNRVFLAFASLVIGVWLIGTLGAQASTRHYWRIPSPDHEQTFAYGTEQSRTWTAWGRDKHLAVLLNFTNDPYVDRQNPRQYDNFTFSFPKVLLGKDGRTFYYYSPSGRLIPVARKYPVFLGTEIRLLPTAVLLVEKPHGLLSLAIILEDRIHDGEPLIESL